ncbi:TRAP transporter small permease [Thermoanaerobacteraceae bacterium SP2]|nr:TRAP transporter small permease [Thermoanaerobacteraceae bacterium SP2]
MRYFFNNPITWLEEFQLWCFVWLAFFGAGAAFRSGSHVAIEVVVDRLPSVPKKIVECIGYLVTMAVFVYFLIYGTKLVQQLYFSGRMTNILKIPYSLIYSALPISCILMMINYTVITLSGFGIIKAEIEGGDN